MRFDNKPTFKAHVARCCVPCLPKNCVLEDGASNFPIQFCVASLLLCYCCFLLSLSSFSCWGSAAKCHAEVSSPSGVPVAQTFSRPESVAALLVCVCCAKLTATRSTLCIVSCRRLAEAHSILLLSNSMWVWSSEVQDISNYKIFQPADLLNLISPCCFLPDDFCPMISSRRWSSFLQCVIRRLLE